MVGTRDECPSAAVRFKREERFSEEGREVEGLTCD
jgi:hypothetical protein